MVGNDATAGSELTLRPVAPPAGPLAPPEAEPRGWLATFAVLAAMVVIVIGGGIAAAVVMDAPLGDVQVGNGVVVLPAPGWQLAGQGDGTILLTKGNASLEVSVVLARDELAILDAIRAHWTEDGLVAAGSVEQVQVAQGLPAARFPYSGSFANISHPVEGEVTGVRGSESVVIFDAWSGVGDFVGARDEVEATIRSARIP